jgi:hypothetical protein
LRKIRDLRLAKTSYGRGFIHFYYGGFKHEVQHGITIDETPLQAF